MKQITLTSFLLGIVLTYGIGLIPALFFRFVIFRRSIRKLGAVVICVFWLWFWSCLILSLRAHSGEPQRLSGGSFFMILLSYMILTKKKFVKLEKAISKIKKNKLVIHCPKCDRLLRGATQEMIGDIGVCPKCKAEFEIKQKKEIEWDM